MSRSRILNFLTSDPVERAKSEVEAAQAAWQKAKDNNAPEQMAAAGRDHILAKDRYQRAIDKHNQENPGNHKRPDPAVMWLPADRLGLSTILSHPIKAPDRRQMPLPTKSDTLLDIKSIPAKNPDDSTRFLTPDEAVKLATQDVFAHCHGKANEALKADEPLIALTRELRHLVSIQLLAAGGFPDGAAITQPMRAELYNLLLPHVENLIQEKLSALFKTVTDELTGNTYLAATPISIEEKRRNAALDTFGLPPATGQTGGTMLVDLQQLLLRERPGSDRIKNLCNAFDISDDQQKELTQLLRSREKVHSSKTAMATEIEDIINNREQHSKGAAAAHYKALSELNACEDWNERVQRIRPEARNVIAPIVAASSATTAIFSAPSGPLDQKSLGDYVQKSVTDNSGNNAKTGTIAKATNQSTQEAIAATKAHLEGKPADLTVTVAANALANAEQILRTPADDFITTELKDEKTVVDGVSVEDEDDDGDEKKAVPAQAQQTAAKKIRQFTQLAHESKHLSALKKSAQADDKNTFQLLVAKAAALGGAIYSSLSKQGVDEQTATTICRAMINFYLRSNGDHHCVTEDIISQCITKELAEDRDEEQRTLALPAAREAAIHAKTALAITQGTKAQQEVLPSAQKAVVKAAIKAGIPASLAAKLGEKIHQNKEAKNFVEAANNHVSDTIFEAETINSEIKRLYRIRLDDIKPDEKHEQPLGTGPLPSELATARMQIAQHYIKTGQFDKATNTEIITNALLSQAQNQIRAPRIDEIKNFANQLTEEIHRIMATAPIGEDKSTDPLPQGIPQITIQKDAHDEIAKVASSVYNVENIEVEKVIQGITAAAEAAGVSPAEAKKAGEEARKAFAATPLPAGAQDGDNSAKQAAARDAAIKVLPRTESGDSAAAVAIAKITDGDEAAIRAAYSQAQPRLQTVATAAIHAGATAAAIGAGLSPGLATIIGRRAASIFLNRGNITATPINRMIDDAVDNANMRAQAIHNHARTAENIGLNDDADPAAIQSIQLALVQHYVAHGALEAADIKTVITQKLEEYNAAHRRAEINIPDDNALQAVCLGFSPEQLVLPDNLPHPLYINNPSAEAKATISTSTIRAYAIAISSVAVKDVAAKHPKPQKQNLREIAAAVVGLAITYELSPEQALTLSQSIIDHYHQHGNFDEFDFSAALRLLNLNPAQIYTIKQAAQAAAAIPATTDAVAGGTLIAAQVFPAFNEPDKAATLAACVTSARNSTRIDKIDQTKNAVGYAKACKENEIDMGNAAAYVKGVAMQVPARSMHASTAAAVAAQISAYMLSEEDDETKPRALIRSTGNHIRDIIIAIEAPDPTNVSPEVQDLADNTKTVVLDAMHTASGKLRRAGHDDAALMTLANRAVIAQAGAIAAEVYITAVKLGIPSEQAMEIAAMIADLNHTSSGESTIAAAMSARQIKISITAVFGRGSRLISKTQRQCDGFLTTAVDTATAGWNRTADLTLEQILTAAKTAYERTKQLYESNGSSHDEALAEALGQQAKAEVYFQALQSGLLSQIDAQMLVHHSECAEYAATDSLSRAGLFGHPPVMSTAISSQTIKSLAQAASTGGLISRGIAAGEMEVKEEKEEKEEKAQTVASRKAKAAMEAVATHGGIPQQAKVIGEKVAQNIIEGAPAPTVGAAAAELEAKSDTRQALAAVAAHFAAIAGNQEADVQAKASATATAATFIEEDRALPTSPKDIEKQAALQKCSEEEMRRKRQAVAGAFATLQAEERISDDKLGIAETMRDYSLDISFKADVDKAGEWTIRITTAEGGVKDVKLEDDETFKPLIEELKQCKGAINIDTLVMAIEQFNKQEKASRTYFGRTFGSEKSLLPINPDTVQVGRDGTLTIKVKDLSKDQVVNLLSIWIDVSKSAKNSAQQLTSPVFSGG